MYISPHLYPLKGPGSRSVAVCIPNPQILNSNHYSHWKKSGLFQEMADFGSGYKVSLRYIVVSIRAVTDQGWDMSFKKKDFSGIKYWIDTNLQVYKMILRKKENQRQNTICHLPLTLKTDNLNKSLFILPSQKEQVMR